MHGAPQITRTQYREGVLYRLHGIIDDTFDEASIDERKGVVVFDLDKVIRFTSSGTRKFIDALASLQADYYCFIRCHASVVQLFNTVVTFAQSGELVSIYAPYICPSCETELESFMDLRNDISALLTPELRCPTCGVPAELDDLPEVFYEYIRSCPPPRPPAAANAIIDGRAQREETLSCIIRKDFAEEVTAIWIAGNLNKSGYCSRIGDGLEGHVTVVLTHLEQMNDSGAQGLARVISESPMTCHLARIPMAMVPNLHDLLARLPPGSADVASLEVPLFCRTCNRTMTFEIDVEVADLPTQGFCRPCPTCREPLAAQIDPHVAALAANLPMTPPPPPVAVYLRVSRSFPSAQGEIAGRKLTLEEAFPSKYRVLRQLGEGGMGQVFLARQLGPQGFERQVVLKRIRRELLNSPEAIHVFAQEARLAAQLIHPNIVQVHELGRFHDTYFMAMEYVNGIDLAVALTYSRMLAMTWPVGICCRIVSDLCGALQTAHMHRDETGLPRPIIHRDVSPGNILLSIDGEVKLADFGVATALDSTLKTPPGVLRGKLGYAAPEHFRDRSGRVDPRVDLYAAGVILYEILSQRRFPISSSGNPRRQTVPPLTRLDVTPALENILNRAVATTPEQRWGSAKEMRMAIEDEMLSGHYTTNHELAIFVQELMAASESEVIPLGVTEELDGPSTPGIPKARDQRGGGG